MMHKLVQERTEALAAVSHDLRTPLIRMRLRAFFLEDAEMEAMIDAALAYVRDDATAEPLELTDLGAMLSTLCDAAADAGEAVSDDGIAQLDRSWRRVSLRRAVSNLIDDNTRFGGGAQVRLRVEASGAASTVEDDGPGIPPEEMDRVMEPFVRLDPARASGVVGLGLAIARDAATGQGGALTLANHRERGLRATLHLP